MITERLITYTAKRLDFLCNAERVEAWALAHLEDVNQFEQGYNELITAFNKYSGYTDFDFMPRTYVLKYILQGRPLPLTSEMNTFDIIGGLIDAHSPMCLGQKIKNGQYSNPTYHEINSAIGTPSMDTTDDALVVGTMGHLIERAFFRFAIKHGIKPKSDWQKDMFLQALDEILLLELARGKTPELTRFFVKSNSEGGLGWLTQEQVDAFKEKATSLLSRGVGSLSHQG